MKQSLNGVRAAQATSALLVPHPFPFAGLFLARQTPAIPNKDRSFHESPEKPFGEGWLYTEQRDRLYYFKPFMATVHAQWGEVRTYSWITPRSPVPITLRLMLRHNAIEVWGTM